MCGCVSIDGWFESEHDDEVDEEEVDEEVLKRVLTFLWSKEKEIERERVRMEFWLL